MDNQKETTDPLASDPLPDAPADQVDLADSGALVATLTAERDQLASERAELYDRLLRRTAEFDNFRRRTERERSELLEFAGMEVVRELLPILDDFERALKMESPDKSYVKGMELIYHRLFDTLKKMGLEPIPAAGRTFDPHLHHAVETEATAQIEENTIMAEHRRGYNFKGRLLRPAMVKVAAKP